MVESPNTQAYDEGRRLRRAESADSVHKDIKHQSLSCSIAVSGKLDRFDPSIARAANANRGTIVRIQRDLRRFRDQASLAAKTRIKSPVTGTDLVIQPPQGDDRLDRLEHQAAAAAPSTDPSPPASETPPITQEAIESSS